MATRDRTTTVQPSNSIRFEPLAIVGMECRLPGAPNLAAYEDLLFSGRHGYGPMPAERLDRSLYFDSRKGQPGKTYSDLGGCVSDEPTDPLLLEMCREPLALFDPVHLNFAAVALRAWHQAGFRRGESRWKKTGVYVGHSGATQHGGRLNLATVIEEGLDFLNDSAEFARLPAELRKRCLQEVASALQVTRPRRTRQQLPRFNGYTAASLPATLLGFQGPRVVCDAACASSLFSLQQAAMALWQGRIDAAIVGGATTNGVDNLILFSQSQACSSSGSSPFDQQASGLISSEGYAAVVIVPLKTATELSLPVLGVVTGLGTASDGRGKSLWAPRAEGQQLAIRRAYPDDALLSIDYLEAHATSTQLGDATELQAVQSLLEELKDSRRTLRIGSAKSNLGHTLETAGVAGLIKILLSMKRREIPPSLKFEQPNPNFQWESGRIRVVDRNTTWVPADAVCRSAVSAFGIGGLNAHLVVEQPGRSVPAVVSSPPGAERIAIVGRGVVLPGAHNLGQFRSLLQSGQSAIGPAPAERWRAGIGISTAEPHRPFTSPTNCGGFIRDYLFDAQPYRIPPKQVKQSNPIQMMLLDAVSQAIGERDHGTWALDRQRAGVVIGTIFGGEFGSALQLGLRIPEITRELDKQLRREGLSAGQIEKLLEEFRRRLLAERPALLDETGSFTASTLASRVAKTFDLMGGACAIDVDDAAGLAGVQLALDQLRCGHWDLAICGAADRSLDLMKFEQLALQGRLVRSGRADDVPENCEQILPGEGVVVLLLQRLSDARAQSLPILGIIDDVNCGPDAGNPAQDAALVRQIGYLSGAQGLVQIVKQTVAWEESSVEKPVCSSVPEHVQIQSRTEDRVGYTVHCSAPKTADRNCSGGAASPVSLLPHSESLVVTGNATATSALQASMTDGTSTTGYVTPVISQVDPVRNPGAISAGTARVFRFSDVSTLGLLSQLERLPAQAASLFDSAAAGYQAGHGCRLALLANSPQQLESRLTALIKQLRSGRQCGVFESDRAVLWKSTPRSVRTAWVFPGQGSQYSELPASLTVTSTVESFLAEFDRELQRQQLDPLLPGLRAGSVNVADIWWNQVWVLGLSLALTQELRQRIGGQADVLLGHSFGEYTALVTAGVLSLSQAIRMVRTRANAVTMTVREPGQLLSVRGTPTAVDALLRPAKIRYEVTHFNSPQQTVIAVAREQVEQVRKTFTESGKGSMPVPVPVAYHTTRLSAAEQLLSQSFEGERFLPARCPVISATTARYLVEPSDLRSSLVEQMTRPVLYAPAVERLLADDVAVLIEVGPNNILSRLNQEIAGERALCLSLDIPGKEHAERLQLIQLVQDIVDFGGSESGRRIEWPATFNESTGTLDAEIPLSARPFVPRTTPMPVPTVPEIEIVDLRRTGTRGPEAVHGERGEHSPPPKPIPSPVVSREAVNATVSLSEIREFLKTVVVDLTGYAPEVVDFDADLEADLGVDSIKKAQIVGEMAEQFELDVAPSGVKLGDLKTLQEIAEVGAQSLSAPPARPSETRPGTPDVEAASKANGVVPAERGVTRESIERFLIDLVVDQTGYSPDVVDLDAHLEADLGIDSIKQAQLFGEVQQQFELENVAPQRTGLSSFSTLRSILDFLSATLTHNGVAAFQLSETTPDQVSRLAEPVKKKSDESPVTAAVPQQTFQGHDVPAKPLGVPPVDQPPEGWRDLFVAGHGAGHPRTHESGEQRGRRERDTIRATLRLLHDRDVPLSTTRVFPSDLEADLAGLAAGAGVSRDAVRGAYAFWQPETVPPSDSRSSPQTHRRDVSFAKPDLTGHVAPPGTETGRYLLRVVPAPVRHGMPCEPVFTGAGLVVGENPFAQAIIQRFAEQGLPCFQVPATTSLAELDQALESIWSRSATPHLFLTTSYDTDALQALDARHWQQRRFAGLEVPYRVCQRWMQRTIDERRMDGGSAVLLTRLGGDFGFSGKTAISPEGGLAGLIKAMLIECWMRGYRATPMKVIDLAPQTTPGEAVCGIWQELAIPTYDMEVAYHGRERLTVQPIHRPLFPVGELQPIPQNGHSQIRPGGVWVITGGARGITAVAVRELAKRHHLKLHLIGTAPVPELTDAMRTAARENRLQLRREVMRQANLRNENGMEAWRNVEKSIEIDATLQLLRSDGIPAEYHSCDVSDFSRLNRTLQGIREKDGGIHGVVHGAGIGQDARFDRKRPDKVDQCLRAKIDGCLNLMDETRGDPLDWFVSFGSISGRFGANGHTDYSLANDSLAKLTDRYRQERPDVRSVTFHWHAWGDIGMATKPETRLALEMISLEFMPASEGLAHFLHELEQGGQEPEVLITDRNYFRKFFPVDRLVPEKAVVPRELKTLPLLDPEETGHRARSILLDPKRERFLNQHLVQQRPTLPFVVAMELLCEAARRETSLTQHVVEIRNLSALQALKWMTDAPQEVHVAAEQNSSETVRCRLTADLLRRDGRLVAKDKVYFEGEFRLALTRGRRVVSRPDINQLNWEPIIYLDPEAAIYHGSDLQCLQKFAMDGEQGIGLISASSAVQLGGGHRPNFGWSIPCAVMDACLYAAAVFAARTTGRPSLPVRFEQIWLGRLPDPGEPCLVRVRHEREMAGGAVLAFELIGLNGDLLVDVNGYQIGWLSQ